LNDYNEIKFFFDHINKNSEKIDHLINNAGVLNNSLFQMTEIENFKTIFEVNFFSQIYLSQLIIKKMIKQKKGNIINISSTSSQDNDFGRSAYSSSKAALNSISKVMSKELSRFNIKVNVIAPGLVDTNLMRDNTEKKYLDDTVSKLNVKRIASPEEISKLALYLSSDDSSYISGEIIRIDGGMGS
jgi:Dehydrogenases with different specificities (related to short-chain alcohol dehydrogenases)